MRSGKNPNIDDDTRARARQFVADAGMPKPVVTANPSYRRTPVVTKEELAKSGLSLRDYMNKQQGLTRRKNKTDPTAGEAIDRAAQEAADTVLSTPARAPGGDAKRRGADTTSTLARTPGGNAKRGGPTSEEEANIMATGGKVKAYAKGGVTRADGICVKGKTKGKMR